MCWLIHFGCEVIFKWLFTYYTCLFKISLSSLLILIHCKNVMFLLLYLVFTEMFLLSMLICVCPPPLNLFINVKLCASYAIDVFQYVWESVYWWLGQTVLFKFTFQKMFSSKAFTTNYELWEHHYSSCMPFSVYCFMILTNYSMYAPLGCYFCSDCFSCCAVAFCFAALLFYFVACA